MAPNAALTRLKATPISCVLRSARDARRPTSTCAAFGIVEICARKRAIPTQILFDFGARSQNSAGIGRVRCATRMTSAQLSAESALYLAPTFCDEGVRNRAKFREKTRGCVANFVRILCEFRKQNSAGVRCVSCATIMTSQKLWA